MNYTDYIEYALNELKSFKDPEDTDIYFAIDADGSSSFTYVPPTEDYISISEDTARTKLSEAMRESQDLVGMVFLYSCPDNALISIEKIKPQDLDEIKSSWAYERVGGGHLYHGRD